MKLKKKKKGLYQSVWKQDIKSQVCLTWSLSTEKQLTLSK